MDGNEDHNIGVDGDDAEIIDEGEAAAREDLRLHPSFCFWNGTMKGTGGGVWVGTGRDEDKTKRKLIPVLPKTRAKMPLRKNVFHGTAAGTLRVSGVGSCHSTDEPATAKHQSLCSSGVNFYDKRKKDKKVGKGSMNMFG